MPPDRISCVRNRRSLIKDWVTFSSIWGSLFGMMSPSSRSFCERICSSSKLSRHQLYKATLRARRSLLVKAEGPGVGDAVDFAGAILKCGPGRQNLLSIRAMTHSTRRHSKAGLAVFNFRLSHTHTSCERITCLQWHSACYLQPH
jgi:hypothetical protein